MRTYVDLSTTGQAVAAEVAAALAERGITTLDAPVSGGVRGAVAGTLAVMVAGPAPELERVRPLLEVFGRVFHVGEQAGLGQLMKLANNFLSATAIAATAEAVVLGVKGGLDPATMLEVINASTGRNTASEDKFPRQILTGRYAAGFTTGLLTKDLGLCAAAAEALGVPMPVADDGPCPVAARARRARRRCRHDQVRQLGRGGRRRADRGREGRRLRFEPRSPAGCRLSQNA